MQTPTCRSAITLGINLKIRIYDAGINRLEPVVLTMGNAIQGRQWLHEKRRSNVMNDMVRKDRQMLCRTKTTTGIGWRQPIRSTVWRPWIRMWAWAYGASWSGVHRNKRQVPTDVQTTRPRVRANNKPKQGEGTEPHPWRREGPGGQAAGSTSEPGGTKRSDQCTSSDTCQATMLKRQPWVGAMRNEPMAMAVMRRPRCDSTKIVTPTPPPEVTVENRGMAEPPEW